MAVRHRMGEARTTAGVSPGTQGTLGGAARAVGARPGKYAMQFGEEVYLWILVIAEVGAIAWLRSMFSRYHGG